MINPVKVIITDEAANMARSILEMLEISGSYPSSSLLKAEEEFLQVIETVRQLNGRAGKTDKVDVFFGTQSTGPTKIFKWRARFVDDGKTRVIVFLGNTRSDPDRDLGPSLERTRFKLG